MIYKSSGLQFHNQFMQSVNIASQGQQHRLMIQNLIVNDFQEAENERDKDKELSDEKYALYFLIFQGFIYLLVVISFGYGNPKHLGVPYDSQNFACGLDVGLENFPYIYFANPADKQYLWRTLCVKNCPVLGPNDDEDDESLLLECYPNALISNCNNRPSEDDPGFSMRVYTSVGFKSACMPTDSSYLANVLDAVEQPGVVKLLSDLQNGKAVIISALCLSFILKYPFQPNSSLAFFWLAMELPRIQVWVVSVSSIISLLLSGLIGILYALKVNSYSVLPSAGDVNTETIIGLVQSRSMSTTFLIIISSAFFACGIAVIIWLIRRHRTVTTIGYKLQIVNYFLDHSSLGQSGDDQENRFTHLTLFLLSGAVALFIFSMCWMQMALHLFSMGESNGDKNTLPFDQFKISWLAYFFAIFLLIELIVFALSVVSSTIFVIIGKLVEIYRQFVIQKKEEAKFRNKEEKEVFSILRTFMRFNIGTVILGEVLIFVTALPRYGLHLYMFVMEKLKKQYTLRDIYYKILSFNDRAYLFAYLRNDNFQQAARDQHQMDEELRKVNRLHNHGMLFKLLYCSAIGNLCLAISYLLIMFAGTHLELNSPTALLMIVFALSYMLSTIFSSVHAYGIEFLTVLMHRDLSDEGPGACLPQTIQLLLEEEIF